MNYDLKISAHVALGDELIPANSKKIESLHIQVKDDPQEGHMPLEEICEFIGMCHQLISNQGFLFVMHEFPCEISMC